MRSLAGRFRVELPLSTDLTEAAKVEWIWSLASLAQRIITVRAVGWLKLTTTQEEEFDECILELSDDGRFTAEWMNERMEYAVRIMRR